ncbi:MAG: SoxR reducing system RseC family protein [Methylotenera sp.]|uniref:SoxR reducing system RseC family protein n=1 Tax=Methylotenera sp. TaxID=2051956 RepID=UPI0024876CF9|nr:SoxR reducing system RseC family protein [Methylotenera sp.]MDI1308332.1 SoxR reducing system RseC family protein [Methylotenera sp.]
MIEEYAIVTKCAGTVATLEIERRTACGLCGQKRGCGNATWGKMLGHDSHDFTAENQINAQVGDSVVVGIDEHAVLNSAFYLYIVPLGGLLIGTLAADYLFKNQFYVIIGAVLGLVLGFLWVKGHLIGHDKSGVAFSKKYQAVILRLAEDDSPENHSELVN